MNGYRERVLLAGAPANDTLLRIHDQVRSPSPSADLTCSTSGTRRTVCLPVWKSIGGARKLGHFHLMSGALTSSQCTREPNCTLGQLPGAYLAQ